MSSESISLVQANEDFVLDHRLPLFGGKLSYFTKAAPIKDRVNEDALCVVHGKDFLFLAVADGMGGHKSGGRASQIAIESIAKVVSSKSALTLSEIVGEIENIHEEIASLRLGSGSTLTVCWIADKHIRFLSIGDSVGYIFSGKKNFRFKTLENSPVGLAVESGLIDEADPRLQEEGHFLFGALGLQPLRFEVSGPIRLQDLDYVVLSTDGITDNFDADELANFLSREEDKLPLAELESEISKRMSSGGKVDDATIVVFEN